MGAFLSPWWGDRVSLLKELVFKWVIKRLVGGKVLFLGGVLIFWQVIYNFGNTTLSHTARLLQIWGDKIRAFLNVGDEDFKAFLPSGF